MDDRNIASVGNRRCKEAVCIHTEKVYDSCRDKECLENLRVFLTQSGQQVLDRAINVRCNKAEVIWVLSDIEPVPFNRGFFTVDLKFFFKVTLDVFCGLSKPTQVEGLATFDKKVVLFGSEGNAKVFQSRFMEDAFDPQLWKKTNMPKAVVEVVDPICLGAKVVDICDKVCCGDNELDLSCIPENIHRVFDEPLVLGGESKRAFVTLGLFTIVKLERSVQLLIPVFDFCVPDKECISATENEPCDLFERIKFPIDEFFPPQREDFAGAEGVFEKPKFCDC